MWPLERGVAAWQQAMGIDWGAVILGPLGLLAGCLLALLEMRRGSVISRAQHEEVVALVRAGYEALLAEKDRRIQKAEERETYWRERGVRALEQHGRD